MSRVYCRLSLLISLLLCFSIASSPAYAEKNLSGVWVGNYSEDYPDRLPGPELGDYGGLPINRVTAVNKKPAIAGFLLYSINIRL
jgi:hypothetical protein